MNSLNHIAAETLHNMRRRWGWFLALGVLLILVGIWALVDSFAASVASIVLFGVVLIVGGLFQVLATFRARGAGHIILLLLLGLLEIIVGWVFIVQPGAGLMLVTMLLAVLFVFIGLFRVITALVYRYPQYGWAILSGVISFILGILLWVHWPVSALWFIGFVIGLNFLFAGLYWTAFALRLKRL